MKKTIITLLACGSIAMGSNVVTFEDVANTAEKTKTLTNGDKVNLKLNGNGKFWVTQSSHSWENQDALTVMNANMGLSYTLADINGIKTESTTEWKGGTNYTYTGGGYSTCDLTLTLKDNSLIGKDIIIYALVTSNAENLKNFTITGGLEEVSYRYATDTGEGFSKTAAFSDSEHDYTMVEIKGTITNQSIIFDSTTQKNGWGMLAYKVIPEPTTATLSLLALVGLAARRRRK